VRQRDQEKSIAQSVVAAAVHSLPLLPPMIMMLALRSGDTGIAIEGWLDFSEKQAYIATVLSDRWRWFDITSLIILCLIIYAGFSDKRLKFSPTLLTAALLLFAVFILLPSKIMGGLLADLRLVPYVFALFILGITFDVGVRPRMVHGFAIAALLFFGARLVGNTMSFALQGMSYDRVAALIDKVAVGSRVASFVGVGCDALWKKERLDHISALLIVRRNAFSNDQWATAGSHLISIKKADAPGFDQDPSQFVTAEPCKPKQYWRTLNQALAQLPKSAFDYVLLIAPPPFDTKNLAGLTVVSTNGRDTLYRIDQ
jgi:hypothetical protein